MRTLWLVNQWNQSCKVTAGSPETHNNLMSRKRSGVWSSPAVFHICSSKNTDSQSLVHFNNFKVEWWWTHQSLKISLASNTDDASQLFSLFEKEETLDVSWWVHLQQAASLISASITNKHPEIHRRHKEKLLTAPEPARESSRLLQYKTNPVISVCTCTAAPQTGTAVNWFCILLMVQIKSCCTVQKVKRIETTAGETTGPQDENKPGAPLKNPLQMLIYIILSQLKLYLWPVCLCMFYLVPSATVKNKSQQRQT